MLGDDPWTWIKGLLKVIKQPLNGGTRFHQLLLRDLEPSFNAPPSDSTSVKPALGHYVRLSLILLEGESLNMLKQHLSVGWQD